jgi:hypothetical protein
MANPVKKCQGLAKALWRRCLHPCSVFALSTRIMPGHRTIGRLPDPVVRGALHGPPRRVRSAGSAPLRSCPAPSVRFAMTQGPQQRTSTTVLQFFSVVPYSLHVRKYVHFARGVGARWTLRLVAAAFITVLVMAVRLLDKPDATAGNERPFCGGADVVLHAAELARTSAAGG